MSENAAEILQVFINAGTAVLSDVFDNLGRAPLVLDNGLFHVERPIRAFAGPAYTVAGESFAWADGSGDRLKLEAIDGMFPGVVAVWAGGDIRGVCCFGDILATAMTARGCAGVVVDGGVRDSAFIRDLGLPVAARYRTPAQAIGRWRVTECQKPVRVRGALEDWVEVRPGDLVVGDEDGVIVVPRELGEEFARRAGRWSDKDGRAREDIGRGMSLIEALEKHGHL